MNDDSQPVHFEPIDLDRLDTLPVEEAVAELVLHAIHLPASDLFLTANQNNVAISVRHLGIVKPLAIVTRDDGRRFISHVKAMAGMDVAQMRRPLDGRWVYTHKEGGKVDLRVNTIPTLYGEDMTIRLLEHGIGRLDLPSLGFHDKELRDLISLLNKPSGLILVTGPTGAGKTTTLYASLRYLHDGTRKINTIEDPIEYELEGIRQSQVAPRIDLDFPELLRAVMRQSPDVIMVGEIRDTVTASTAVRAANSGHLVFATLHAPVAAAAVDSMLAFGVHPHFLSTSLLGIVTQRLVRTLCESCKVSYDISGAPRMFDDVKNWLEPNQGNYIYAAPGCEK
jgi:type II secretory ATPase GspE/PulE/Tfp pilus assembly ATPase PilB-like protein